MPQFAPQAAFLGATTPLGSAASTTGVIVFGPGWGHLFIYHYIAGYSGSAIALIRLGTGTTTDSGTNYSSATSHFVMGGTTVGTSNSRVSQTGIHVANDAVTNARKGLHQVHNPATQAKTIDGRTATYGGTSPTAATAYSTLSLVVGIWNNTAAQAQCCEMFGNGVNLNAGSYISVYGIPGTG
jgi:hypothetical protein